MHACSQRLSLNFKLEMIWVSNGFCNSSVGLLQSSDPSLPLWWFVQVRAWVRSPLYVHFSEVLGGLVHIRAYGLQQRRLNTVVIVGSWRWVWEGLRWFENQSSTLHSRAFALCDVIALVQPLTTFLDPAATRSIPSPGHGLHPLQLAEAGGVVSVRWLYVGICYDAWAAEECFSSNTANRGTAWGCHGSDRSKTCWSWITCTHTLQ